MAAVTYALVANSCTPYSVKYTVTSTGVATGNLDAAGAATPDLLTDTTTATVPANGSTPLHDLLATVVTDAATARQLAFNRELDIQLLPMTGAGCDWVIDADDVGGTDLRLMVTTAAAGTAKLVIRFRKEYSR